MIKIIRDIFAIPELRNRVLYTLSLLAIFRVGFFIYLPGIDIEAHQEAISQREGSSPLDFFLYTSRLTGGSFTPVLFSLGIMPYISASIIFSLLVKVFPRLEALSKEGAQGRKVINRYTRYATLVLCLIQGGILVSAWQGSGSVSQPLAIGGWPMSILQVMCLTAGSLFLMWLGEKITEYGIGNGASLIIMTGIIAEAPAAIAILLNRILGASPDDRPFEVTYALMMLGLFLSVVAAVVFITKGQRRIPVQQQRAVKGRRVYGGQRHYMPIKVNAAGVLPIIFASSLIMIPTLFLQNISTMGTNWFFFFIGFIADAFAYPQFLYSLAYVALIFFFTFFWTSLMFNPVELANNLKDNGNFIPGIRPGKRTAEYLEKIIKRVTLAGAAFLSVIALAPQFVGSAVPGMNQLVLQFLGGTSILIVVGVALDLVEKIEAQLLMRQYEGFIRGGEGPRKGGGPEKKPVPSV